MFALHELPSRVAQKIQPNDETECWVWTACRDKAGYGKLTRGRRTQFAHRLTYSLLVGETSQMLDHLCRNPACVNPRHLEPVTNRENQMRGEGFVSVNAAKTHCVNGHPFDDRNTYRRAGSEQRDCRACGRVRQAKAKAKRLRRQAEAGQ